MNIKRFCTNKRHLVIASVLLILVIASALVFTNISRRPGKDLLLAIDTAWNSAKAENQPAFLIKLDELSSYKLDSVNLEDDRYIINATVTAPDLGAQLSQLDPGELPQAEDVDAFLCEQLEKAEIKKTKAYIYAYKINGEYHVTFSDDFVDAMSGKLYKYSQKALVEVLQGYKEGELK